MKIFISLILYAVMFITFSNPVKVKTYSPIKAHCLNRPSHNTSLSCQESQEGANTGSGDYAGMYQMGCSALMQIGCVKKGTNCSNSSNWIESANCNGATSLEKYKSDPDAQLKSVEKYREKLFEQINIDWKNCSSNIGKTIQCNVTSENTTTNVKITKTGLLTAAHLVGAGAVCNCLEAKKYKWNESQPYEIYGLKSKGNCSDGSGVPYCAYAAIGEKFPYPTPAAILEKDRSKVPPECGVGKLLICDDPNGAKGPNGKTQRVSLDVNQFIAGRVFNSCKCEAINPNLTCSDSKGKPDPTKDLRCTDGRNRTESSCFCVNKPPVTITNPAPKPKQCDPKTQDTQCKTKGVKEIVKKFNMNEESFDANQCECVDKPKKAECKEDEEEICGADPDNCRCEKTKPFAGCKKTITCVGKLYFTSKKPTEKGFEIFCEEGIKNPKVPKAYKFYSTKLFSKSLLNDERYKKGYIEQSEEYTDILVGESGYSYANDIELPAGIGALGYLKYFKKKSSRSFYQQYLSENLCQDKCNIGDADVKKAFTSNPDYKKYVDLTLGGCLKARKQKSKSLGATAYCDCEGNLHTEIPDENGNVEKKMEAGACSKEQIPEACTIKTLQNKDVSWECKMNVCSGTLESGYWNAKNAFQTPECSGALKSAMQWQLSTKLKCKADVDCTGKNLGMPTRILPVCSQSKQRGILEVKVDYQPYLPCLEKTSISSENEGMCVGKGNNDSDEMQMMERVKNPKPYRYEFQNSDGMEVIERETAY